MFRVMISISANQKFQVPCDKFSLYAGESTQISISADGTNFTNFGEPISGTVVYKDNPRGLFIKGDHDLGLSY